MDDVSARRSGQVALAGVVLFSVAALGAHVMRPDLSWQQAPLSLYLLGQYGPWLQAGYIALAVALIALATGWMRALRPEARSGAPALLFVVAAIALVVTAIAETALPGRAPTLEGFIHGLAARTTFLCVTVAMMLQAWRLRGDLRWRPWFGPALAWATAAFVSLWVHALWTAAPRGLTQRVVILLVTG